ncbi:MAG: phosphoenolpyruvate--protein phosphotransferase [Lentisphaerae bacterium]|nr:phosphoenolpyruvate--protein phosphotransferase [Lentisphaerota bacterium]
MTAKTHHREERLQGVPLSNGVAVARVCLFNESRHSNLPMYRVTGKGVEREIQRVRRAADIAVRTLTGIRDNVAKAIGPAEAGIFEAQIMILGDEKLRGEITAALREDRINAESAVESVLDRYEARLQEVDDAYIKERASDFGEVKRRLLDALRHMRPQVQCDEAHCQRGRNRIIVAEELTPQLTVDLDTGHTMGFVAERGGRHSHAAILARALGIPAVSGLAGIRDRVHCGMELLINGGTGEVILNPRERTVLAAHTATPELVRRPQPVPPVAGLRVLANISLPAEARDALALQAEGIGLYRTEIELIAGGGLRSEDALLASYRSVLEVMDGRPVTFRLFDIGSDKTLPALRLPREDNPSLGLRGARLLLQQDELLAVQARALARASRHGDVRVLYPMITDTAQFLELRKRFRDAVRDIPHGSLQHGVMFEVPSACFRARELLEAADFGSVGTNDLTQYLFAVDRDNALVAADYRPRDPVLWDVLDMLVRAAHDTGKSLSVCGEVAGDPSAVARLIEAGIRELSVSTRMIPSIRATAAKILDNKGNTDDATQGQPD